MLNFKSSGVKIKMSISAETTPLLGGIIVLIFFIPIQQGSWKSCSDFGTENNQNCFKNLLLIRSNQMI
jgi:hypothetical protein